jgi:glycine/D-amino acid oxidase-like deaminating enzyme
VSAPVIIVGGGIVGCSTAYFLARDGVPVTLVEQHEVSWGASGRNPGFVWLHCRNPGFALDVSLAARQLYPQLVEELPLPFEFRESGGLIFYLTPEQGDVVEEFVAARCRDGLPMEMIEGAEVRRLVPPIREDVMGASYCPADAHINTPLFVRSLAEGARRHGAEIREGVTVTALARDGERVVGVETDAGRIEGAAVVVAAGAWTRRLLRADGLDVPIGAERLGVIGTRPLEMRIEPVVYGPLAAKQYTLFRNLASYDDAHFTAPYEEHGVEMLELVAQRATGEVLLGCPMDYPSELDDAPTLEGLLVTARAIAEDFPGLRDAPIDRVWAGLLPFTPDTLPIIDEPSPGLFIASGHVFGNAAGPMTGVLLSQLIRGLKPDIDLTDVRLDRGLDLPEGAVARW